MKFFASCLFWALLLMLQAQSNGVGIGTGAPPHPSAMLDIQDTTGGLLYPRLTTAQRNAINNPAPGLTIFNTTSQCFEAYFANGWKATACACNSFPDPSFTIPGFVPVNQAASFSATTGGATYAWTFPSGTPASSNLQNPQVTWAKYRNLYGKTGGYRQPRMRRQLDAVGYRNQLPSSRIANL